MTWFNDTPAGRLVKSFVKTFAAVVLGLFLADGADVLSVDASDLRTWAAAGLAAALPLAITALDPTDGRFGRGSEEDTVDTGIEPYVAEDYKGE